MGAFQFEHGSIMLIDRECGFFKGFSSMARCAIRNNSLCGKLPVMVILMAVNTFLMPDRVCHIPLMTGFARDIQVLVDKREFRL